MGVVESAAQFMEQICNDNSHGYSQANRWGSPDYDCSSLVISCYEQAGVPVKTKGASYTGNMYGVFRSCGFTDVTSNVNLASGDGLIRGDVLLNSASHTALYLGSGKVGHARSSEGNSQSGDQSGNEIRIQSYWNYPWNYVLRYPESSSGASAAAAAVVSQTIASVKSVVSKAVQMAGRYPLLTAQFEHQQRDDVKALQALLSLRGATITTDGYYGQDTANAVKELQAKYGLEQDGECGSATWYCLITNGN